VKEVKGADPNAILQADGEDELRRRHDGAWSKLEDGANLLDDLCSFLRRFIAYPSANALVAHGLWIVHTHLMDCWESTPRIAFLSPEPGSGKTRALEVSELLVPNPIEAVNVTAAYLFRKVGSPDGAPTILYDEIDTVFGAKTTERNEEIRGLLNAGHRRNAVAGRCVMRGRTVETEEIPAYCAVALAGIGDLPDTVLSRSVIVRMRRRAPQEQIEPFRRRVHATDGERLRERISCWAHDVQAQLSTAEPDMPSNVTDRDADVWEPLLAIADKAGGKWPTLARVAAVALVAHSKESTPSLGLCLLSDVRIVFQSDEQISTESLLKGLHDLPEAPWSDIRGKPLNERGLAQRLRQYGVKPKVIRIGNSTPRGYQRADFADAWNRYLSPLPKESATSATSSTSSTTGLG
jgi:hypothetical protein